MLNIRPVSDLRNKYPEIEQLVLGGEEVYLTKNGHGQIAMVDMKELDEMEKELALYRFRFGMEKGEASITEEARAQKYASVEPEEYNI